MVLSDIISIPKLPGPAGPNGFVIWLDRWHYIREHQTLVRILNGRLGIVNYLHDHLNASYTTVVEMSGVVLVFALIMSLRLIYLVAAKARSSGPARPYTIPRPLTAPRRSAAG